MKSKKEKTTVTSNSRELLITFHRLQLYFKIIIYSLYFLCLVLLTMRYEHLPLVVLVN